MEQVWYVAYGSNLGFARFRCYLKGGRPAGGARTYAGCRDRSDPTETFSLEIPGAIAFAGASKVWTGGMAFLDPLAPGAATCRAYLVTTDQFADIAAQEMREPPGVWSAADVIRAVRHGDRLGTGSYNTVVQVGSRAAPMLTITCAEPEALELAPPSAGYLRTIGSGLRESAGWSSARAAAYLSVAPGAAGSWTSEQVEALLDQPEDAGSA